MLYNRVQIISIKNSYLKLIFFLMTTTTIIIIIMLGSH